MVLIPCSVDVVLPKSLYHFRFTTVADSNLVMSKTTLFLIFIDKQTFYLKYTVQNLNEYGIKS